MSGRLPQEWQAVQRSALGSAKLHEVPELAELLYYKLLLAVDDFGRHPANPGDLASGPMRKRVALGHVSRDAVDPRMAHLRDAGLLRTYTVEGERFLELVDFRTLMRTPKKRYPGPEEGEWDADGPGAAQARPTNVPPEGEGEREGDREGEPNSARARATPPPKPLDLSALDPALDSRPVLDAWLEWESCRKGGRYAKQATRNAALRKLNRHAAGDPARAIAMLEHSSAGGFQGLYPPGAQASAPANGKPKGGWLEEVGL